MISLDEGPAEDLGILKNEGETFIFEKQVFGTCPSKLLTVLYFHNF